MATISGETVYSVSQITNRIKGNLESEFAWVCVQGEISGFTRAASGHAYFALKDKNSVINSVFFKGEFSKLKFTPEEGMEVIAKGRITVYGPRGAYQLQTQSLSPLGAGALHLAFEQTKRKLEKEGLFDLGRKRKLPSMPRKIGLITSPAGAVIRDLLSVIARRFPAVHLILNPVRVQGEGAAEEVAAAIDWFNANESPDLLIVGRGGGSIEDLSAFNEEILARAAFRSQVPVVSAVGHETDFTILDFVADVRAPTPSAAAEISVPVKNDLVLEVQDLRQALRRAFNRFVSLRRLELNATTSKIRSPNFALRFHEQTLDEMTASLHRSRKNLLEKLGNELSVSRAALSAASPLRRLGEAGRELESATRALRFAVRTQLEALKKEACGELSKLDSLSPLKTLSRGYSLTLDKKRKPLRSVENLQKGATLITKLEDGEITAKITSIHPENQPQLQIFEP